VLLGGFVSAGWFVLLVPVVVVVAGYVWVAGRRRRYTMRFTNLALLERIAPRRPGWPRHVPGALLVTAMVLLIVALAGPTSQVRVPRNRALVMLVIDVSLSMNATDVIPTRLLAAQDAAISFARGLTPGINLGLESFAGTASVLVAPTPDRAPVTAAVTHLQLAESTATGEAIATALTAIDTFNQEIPGGDGGAPPARIVLMSDGKQTVGRDEFAMASKAGAAHIPISTISYGTLDGTVTIGGHQIPVPVADADLARVAQLSGGDFYPAQSNDQVHHVYDTLTEQLGYQSVTADASKTWLALGTLMCLVAAGAALAISQRLPA